MADFFDRFSGTSGLLTAHTPDAGGTTWLPGAMTGLSINGTGAVYSPQPTDTDNSVDFFGYTDWTPPSSDYEAQAVFGATFTVGGGTGGAGPTVRHSGTEGNQTCYFLQLSGDGATYAAYLITESSGARTFTQVGTNQTLSPPLATGDTLSLSAAGTGATVTLVVKRNGTQIYTIGDTSGGRIVSTGSAGLFIYQVSGLSGNDTIRTLWAGAIGGPAALTIAPTSATVAQGGTHSFTVSTPFTNETFGWTATHGSISGSAATETYTAPGSGTSDTVTGTSADLPLRTASATVTLTPAAAAGHHRHRKGPNKRRLPMLKRLDFPLPTHR